MAQIESLFVTRLYRAALSEHGPKIDASELENSFFVIAQDDDEESVELLRAEIDEDAAPGEHSSGARRRADSLTEGCRRRSHTR